MKKNLLRLTLCALLFAIGFPAQAQQQGKVPRIGFLLPTSRSAVAEPLDAFRGGLRELGYVEGQNIVIEYRSADGNFDRLPHLAADLVHLKVDLIVAGALQAIQPAKNATSTIPIVMTGTTDPVLSGLIANLARPGGNITGLTNGGPELYGKRLELLKETVPKSSRIAFFLNPTSPSAQLWLNETQASARVLGLRINSFGLPNANDFERAFQDATKWGADAFTVAGGPEFTTNRKPILRLAVKNRLPGIYPFREYVEEGGLMSYAPSLSDLYRRAARYVDKILKGARAAELPVEQPTRFEFIINLKAARQIDLVIPANVLALANKVIR